ncbi:hypothetical protein A8990_10644 [Paenibacillus taihuensis]|uniref:Uncharacterized protein n=1 Tax=Paenibacillus taihuensis TaxID=1156355 RepID=A0A3D9SH26_9BACL|nr:hypothetical protein [Paenibacillus taihuensis]REE90541.1 hypothetical protein A8990_10644 [Paenibacillus taihuensis]
MQDAMSVNYVTGLVQSEHAEYRLVKQADDIQLNLVGDIAADKELPRVAAEPPSIKPEM